MAEVTALRNNALPYPVYAAPWTVVFPLLDADGDLVTGGGADTPDSEISKNGDTFADCASEMTEVATASGMYYLSLTGTELTADIAAIICKTATAGTKTTPIVLYPRKLVTLASGTSAGGAVGYITLASGAVVFNGQYNGCLCVATIDGNVEARILQVCTSSNDQCTVTPNWNVAPDADDTYIVYLPEGMQIPTADIQAVDGDLAAAANLNSACDNYSVTRGLTGTAVPAVASGAALGIPLKDVSNFLDVANMPAVAAGGTNGLFIAGTNAATSITTALTANIIGDITGTLATVTTYTGNTLQTADVADLNDITAESVWAVDASNQQTQGTFGQAIGDPVADTTTIYQSVATDAQGDNVAVDVAAAVGTDGLCLISVDPQDLSATLDVNTKTITNGIIVAATLGADAITAAKIADNAIASEHLATGALTADAFAANALIAATFNTGAFTADAFAADALVAATFATGAFTADAFAANAIVAATLAADCITEAKIADDAIAAEHIASAAIVAATFAANAITSTVVADNTITAAKINADAITAAKIADDAFVAANFATGALTADAFAANALIAATFAADYLAAINAEVDTALTTTTYGEPGQGAPPATASLEDKIGYLYKMFRNEKRQSATEFDLYNNAGDTIDQQSAVSDSAGVATKGEMGTGA